MNQNAIDPANNLSTENVMPEVKISEQDPEFNYKFNDTIFPQKYAVMSFISPNDVHKDFNLFAIHGFFESYMNSKLESAANVAMNYYYNKFNEIITGYIRDQETIRDNDPEKQEISTEIINKLQKAMTVINENNTPDTKYIDDLKKDFSDFNDIYQTFYETNKTKIFDAYNKSVNYVGPNVCAVKVLGVFENIEKAKESAKEIFIPNNPYNNMFIGEVGRWHAWSSDYTDCENTEYMNESLQKLMDSYKSNMKQRNDAFEKRREESIAKNKESSKNSIKEKYLK